METSPIQRSNNPSTQHPEWIEMWGIAPFFEIVRQAGGEIRVVGGAIRNALIGLAVMDIDFATTLLPEQVNSAFESAGYKVVPTGIEHGTVTVVVDAKGYEITTLRRDVASDGRHARIAFSGSWEEDAARRDFTINALYLDEKGNLYDYNNGLADINSRRLAFIGDAKTRILEDALRILRYFRFTAVLGLTERTQIDFVAFEACRDHRVLIKNLSAERIRHEFMALLKTPSPLFALQLMVEADVLRCVLSGTTTTGFMPELTNVESTRRRIASPFARLIALTLDQMPTVLAKKLKLSRKETKQLVSIHQGLHRFRAVCDEGTVLQLLHEYGSEITGDSLQIAEASGCSVTDDLYMTLEANKITPAFPLTGSDVLALGVPSGRKIGEVLSVVTEWWSKRGFRPNRDECLAFLRTLLGNN